MRTAASDIVSIPPGRSPPRRMQKKTGFATVTLALLAAARSISDDLGYDGHQVHAAAGNNLTENGDFPWFFATTESNANTIVKRHSEEPHERPPALVGTVKLSRNSGFWIGKIQIGTPRRGRPRRQQHDYEVIVDSASPPLWVTSSTVRQSTFFNKYNPRKSGTSRDFKRPFEAHYGSASVRGSTYYDTVNVAGIKVNMSFGSVTEITGIPINIVADGILGLSPPNPARRESRFIHNAKEKYPAFNPVAAFYFGTGEPELHLGQVKEVYLGEIEYHPLISVNEYAFWAMGSGDIIVGENNVVVAGIRTFFDTGMAMILGPPEGVAKIYQDIPDHHTYQVKGQVRYRLPCIHVPKVSFRWNNGNPWPILHEQLLFPVHENSPWCLGPFVGRKFLFENPEDVWQLGYRFMLGKYIIFDTTDQRIGVAKAK